MLSIWCVETARRLRVNLQQNQNAQNSADEANENGQNDDKSN